MASPETGGKTAPYVNDASTLEDGFGTTLAGDQVARMALKIFLPFPGIEIQATCCRPYRAFKEGSA